MSNSHGKVYCLKFGLLKIVLACFPPGHGIRFKHFHRTYIVPVLLGVMTRINKLQV